MQVSGHGHNSLKTEYCVGHCASVLQENREFGGVMSVAWGTRLDGYETEKIECCYGSLHGLTTSV